MKRNHNKKALTLLVCLVMVVAVTVGGTLAYLMASTQPVKNEFTASKVSSSVVEEPFDGTTKTNVRVQNTGDTKAYIRAKVVVTWKNTDGEVYVAAPMEGTDYTMELNLSENGWVKGNDAFYYFTQAVSPVTECTHAADASCDNCCTDVLIKSCVQAESANVPDEYVLSVEIVASAIQSAPDSVVENAWTNSKVTVFSNNGTLEVRNITGG